VHDENGLLERRNRLVRVEVVDVFRIATSKMHTPNLTFVRNVVTCGIAAMGIERDGECRVEEYDVVDERLRLGRSKGCDNASLAFAHECDALGIDLRTLAKFVEHG